MKMTIRLTLTALLSLAISVPSLAEDQASIKAQLFTEVETALTAAKKANAEFYAPASFNRGVKQHRSGEEKYKRKKSLQSITEILKQATVSLQQSESYALRAQQVFEPTIQARNDAFAAEAAAYAPTEWESAEKQFARAIKKLEGGKKSGAEKTGKQALSTFRAAELAAIKNNYLAEARRLITSAEQQKVGKYAPETLSDAKRLLAQAETELNENRYDTDKARYTAREAKIQAGHSIYLTNELKQLRKGAISAEQFALKSEVPLQQIAIALDKKLELDAGPETPTQQMVQQIEQLRANTVELAAVKQEMAELEQDVKTLNAKLGLQSDRLEYQANIKRKITLLENIFSLKEALVYRQGGNILVRMVGLNFASGQSLIRPEYFELLRKLMQGLKAFPDATITIEGHTDSFGGDAINLQLSQARADAVASYLLANMDSLSDANLSAVGYGESKPVANNETAAGRKKNRRIDLLIKPNF